MEKMRILIVTMGKLSNVLGAVKVHYDLKQEYERKGHSVDVLDVSVIYPKGRTTLSMYLGRLPTYKIWKYLKSHACNYDVIDANIETVVYSKESFDFKGVLLARSHGIRPLYDQAESIPSYKKSLLEEKAKYKLKTHIGNFIRGFRKDGGMKGFWQSITHADIVHCLNWEEHQYYIDNRVAPAKLLYVPNALPDGVIENFNKQEVVSINRKSISFLASWSIRKGIKDLNAIIDSIQKIASFEHLYLIGGYADEDLVKKEFAAPNLGLLQIIPHFQPEELASYLANCRVGVFLSYVEGFGYAVLEQIACGVPVVSYKIAGPTDMLTEIDQSLLIEPGNIKKLSEKVVEILQMDEKEYLALSNRCKEESRKFLLSEVSNVFLNAFHAKLNNTK